MRLMKFTTEQRELSRTSLASSSARQLRALAPHQFYQIVDVPALGEEAVDVYPERAPPVQYGRREPRAAAALDALLQGPLQLVLFCGRTPARPLRQKADAAQSRLHLADALELFQFVEARGEIVDQINLPLDHFGVAANAHGLQGHPDLERHGAARAELAVAEEVVLNVRAAALLAQVFGRDVERVAKHRAALANQERAALERDEHPLVRVERHGVGALYAAQTTSVLFTEREAAAVCR